MEGESQRVTLNLAIRSPRGNAEYRVGEMHVELREVGTSDTNLQCI